MYYKIIIMILILITPGLSNSNVLDNTINRFYMNHRHPILDQGENLMGHIIIQNNNPAGFKVNIESINNGKLVPKNKLDGETNIHYKVKFDKGSGRIGSGLNVNLETIDLDVSRDMIEGIIPESDTDVSIGIIIDIEAFDAKNLMSGHYQDKININYENY